MSERAGEKDVARFNPEDLYSGLHIETFDGSYLGFAECRQKVGFFDLVGAKQEARRKRRITKAQKELLEKFAESMGKATNKHSPNETSWIDSVKKFFEDMKS